MAELTLNQKLHKDRDSILHFCRTYKNIRLFGSGDTAILLFRYLSEEDIPVTDFIMTNEDIAELGSTYCGHPVTSLSVVTFSPEDGVIITSEAWMQGFVLRRLFERGLGNCQVYQQGIYGQYTEMWRDPGMIRPGYEGNDAPEGFFSRYTELNQIGHHTGTDKADHIHNYLNKYEFFLSRWKDSVFTLLELGIFRGDSLKMWQEFFPNAKIIGVDINEKCKQFENERTKVVIADLSLEEELQSLASWGASVIIDDASHIWSHQIKAICTLFSTLPHGGIYILEDLETSFSAYRFMNFDDSPVSAYEFCATIAEVITGGEHLQASKKTHSLALLQPEIESIASQTEFIGFLKGSCILIRK